jgi:replicative DNA helicase
MRDDPKKKRDGKPVTIGGYKGFYDFHKNLIDDVLEGTILGCAFVENDLIDLIETRIVEDDFFGEANRLVYVTMQRLRATRSAIDHISVRNMLHVEGKLHIVGGDEYLFSLTNRIPTTENIETYLTRLADLGQQRRVVMAAAKIVAVSNPHEGKIPEDVASYAIAEIAEAAQKKDSTVWGGDARMVLVEQMKTFEKNVKHLQETGAKIVGCTTGLRDLDGLTGGTMPGDVVIIAARPGMGKTSFMLNTVMSNVDHDHLAPVFTPIFSLEMPRVQMNERIMCQEGNISSSRYRKAQLTADEMHSMMRVAEKFAAMNGGAGPSYAIFDKPAITLNEIRVIVRRERKKWAARGIPLGPVFIDYLQLMSDDARSNARDREQQIANISRGLKVFAKEEETTVYALSQLNRGVEARGNKSKRPQLSDLRESGAIEQDADAVWFIYRDEVYNPDSFDKGIAEIIVGKARAGATGTVRCGFYATSTRFHDLDANSGGEQDVSNDMAGF